MTDDDIDRFAQALAVLAETFDVTVSDARAEGYFAALRDLSWAQVHHATREALATLRWFPKPVELRELACGRAEDAAEDAWGAVVNEARRVGAYSEPSLPPAAKQTIDALFGGWRNFCAAEVRGPEGVGWRKQFLATYTVYARREQDEARLQLSPGEAREVLTRLRDLAKRKSFPTPKES